MITPVGMLTTRDRRTLVLGITIIAAIVVSARVVPAWRRWQVNEQRAADVAALGLARSRAELVGQRAAHDSLAARTSRLDSLRAAWLDGDTPAAAGAALAGEVSSAGERARVTIGALDIRVDSVGGAVFVPVRVQATATGDIQGIVNFLADIEGDRVNLSIRALSINAADAAAPTNTAELLRADLTIEGPWRRESRSVGP